MSNKNELPTFLKHKPIISVKYSNLDESEDAKFLSLGYS